MRGSKTGARKNGARDGDMQPLPQGIPLTHPILSCPHITSKHLLCRLISFLQKLRKTYEESILNIWLPLPLIKQLVSLCWIKWDISHLPAWWGQHCWPFQHIENTLLSCCEQQHSRTIFMFSLYWSKLSTTNCEASPNPAIMPVFSVPGLKFLSWPPP